MKVLRTLSGKRHAPLIGWNLKIVIFDVFPTNDASKVRARWGGGGGGRGGGGGHVQVTTEINK